MKATDLDLIHKDSKAERSDFLMELWELISGSME